MKILVQNQSDNVTYSPSADIVNYARGEVINLQLNFGFAVKPVPINITVHRASLKVVPLRYLDNSTSKASPARQRPQERCLSSTLKLLLLNTTALSSPT